MKKILLSMAALLATATSVSAQETAPNDNANQPKAERTFVRRVCVEEFTGTGCGYCPRGMLGMEMLRRDFGDRFVGIAIHQYNNSGDAMQYDAYPNLGWQGAPECKLDRTVDTDPYYGTSNTAYGIKQVFQAMLNQPAEVGVEVKGAWNADSTKVTVTAEVEGLYDGNEYKVEMVLIADSLTGIGSSWSQANYYATSTTTDPNMAIFCKGGKYGSNPFSKWPFCDVAFASTGKNNAQTVVINGEEKSTVSYTLSLPTSGTIKKAIKKKNVAAIALVTNADGTVIYNSAKAYMPYAGQPTAITTLADSQTDAETARFAMDGRQLASPQKGLNIVRMADGTTRKVIVR